MQRKQLVILVFQRKSASSIGKGGLSSHERAEPGQWQETNESGIMA